MTEKWWRSTDKLELIATVMMAMAAILTAWTGFQSAKWSGQQAKAFAQASALRTESIRFDNDADQARSIDVAVFISWLEAVNADLAAGGIDSLEDAADPQTGSLSAFIYERVRDEFRPAFEAWIGEYMADREAAPSTPFAMDEYQLAADAESERLAAEAQSSYVEATEYNERSDRYVLTTVLFALVLFFSGVSSKLKTVNSKSLAVGIGMVLLVVGIVAVGAQPIHPLIG